tara:strand:+ start:825 stop:998 length:174 start_codon:yes stop_codon:yes gene_type:complete
MKKLTKTQVKKKMDSIVKNMYSIAMDKFDYGTKSNVPFSYNMIAGLNNKLAGLRDKV